MSLDLGLSVPYFLQIGSGCKGIHCYVYLSQLSILMNMSFDFGLSEMHNRKMKLVSHFFIELLRNFGMIRAIQKIISLGVES